MSTHDPSHSAEPTGEKQHHAISSTAVRQMIISTAIMALVLVSLTAKYSLL